MKWVWPVVFALMKIGAAASPPSPAAAQANNIKIVPDPEQIGLGTKATALIADGGLHVNPNRIDEYEEEDIELATFTTDRSFLWSPRQSSHLNDCSVLQISYKNVKE